MTGNASTQPRSRKFSLRLLMGVIALCAVVLGVWRAFFIPHPAHQFSEYQRAPYTTAYQYQAGPNTITIRSIARNRYDGTVHLISTGGLSSQIPDADQLTKCAAWLDVVQIELTPGPKQVEIIESRVFDHESRTLLSEIDRAYGWRVTDSNVLQVYGMGKEVPEKLDVWLRLYSYADDTIYTIGVTPGDEVEIPGGTLHVAEVKEGYSGWSKEQGFFPTSSGGGSGSAVLFDWQGDWRGKPLICTAVTDLGERDQGGEQLLKPEWNGHLIGPATSRCSLELIDHLEIRQAGKDLRFFFDGVKVPPPVGRTFDPPPFLAIIKTDQGETAGVLHELAPLLVHYRVESEANIDRMNAYSSQQFTSFSIPTYDPLRRLGLQLRMWGLSELPLALRVKDAQTQNWKSVADKDVGTYKLTGSHGFISLIRVAHTLAEIDAIEVTVNAP
ncbi:hypothetical protein DTL42_12915 [Bremerella cremea]|uniref:Uncharacterized protein n=1 Tax=Bremerella cremea TaxID=1031537 RepID=A0A368KRJ1_9BACT|nr:hypothetical protein [Bremerella cremea]RCS49421.1 hypothetical protein DTL42_12915 [Bremerella cremea]